MNIKSNTKKIKKTKTNKLAEQMHGYHSCSDTDGVLGRTGFCVTRVCG